MPLITLTTDFGSGSPYVAAMKGVILSTVPKAAIVDISHDIGPRDVRQGAIVLDEATRWYPRESIHMAVIDPGVGTDRGLIYAAIGGRHYLAPDNGLLSRMVRERQPERIVRLTRPEHWLSKVSATFHGRDILAPVAALLCVGLNPGELGDEQQGLAMLAWPEPTVEPMRIVGHVEWIDAFGNAISNIAAEHLGRMPFATGRVVCCGHTIDRVSRTYGEQDEGTSIALLGSSGWLEIAVAGGHAAQELGLAVGDEIVVHVDEVSPAAHKGI